MSDGSRKSDQTIVWRTYVLALDDICRWAAIPVPVGASIDAELADRTALRLTIKSLDES